MVIIEYGDGGTLREYLQDNSENLHWSIRLKFAKQLCNGISFLHENNLIHRNLVSNCSNFIYLILYIYIYFKKIKY